MAPHLARAQSAYKDIRIRSSYHHHHHHTHTHRHTQTHTDTHTHTHSHTHTHTHTHRLQIHALLVTGWYNVKKENDRSVCRREEMGVFSFEIKEESEDKCLTERRSSRSQVDVMKRSLPYPRNTEDPSIWGCAKRARRRAEMKQLWEVWRSCTRDNVVRRISWLAA